MSTLFGLDVSTSAAPGTDPAAAALRAEELGFDLVSASDHPCGDEPSHETWTMLSWIAARTSRIRIATRVLGVPYRNPAMVAKMAATLDRLSGGRLVLGLGGGYSDDEFRAFGLDVPTPGEKVAGLDEAVRITRGLWSDERFTLHGRHHRVDDAAMEPKPDRAVPIWLGTFGDRALRVTGRLADGWIPSLSFAGPDRIPAMRDRILAAAADAGRDPAAITLAYNVEVRFTERPLDRTDLVSGPPAAVVERLAGFGDLGFTAFNFMVTGADAAEQTRRLAREVLPDLRAALAACRGATA